MFHSTFSLKAFILWPPKRTANKSTTQTSVFDRLADVCAVAMETSININRLLKSVLFICKNLVVRFSLQFACNKHVPMLRS